MALFIDPIIMKLMTMVVQADGMTTILKVFLCIVLACIGTVLGVGLLGLFMSGE